MARLCNPAVAGYPAPMSFRLRPRSPQGLRLLALLVLVIGLVAKPILVVACELDDLRLAQSSSEATHEAVLLGGSQASDGPASDACCPGQTCGECCTAGNMLPAPMTTSAAMPVDGRPAVELRVHFEPTALPVAIRPPIAA